MTWSQIRNLQGQPGEGSAHSCSGRVSPRRSHVHRDTAKVPDAAGRGGRFRGSPCLPFGRQGLFAVRFSRWKTGGPPPLSGTFLHFPSGSREESIHRNSPASRERAARHPSHRQGGSRCGPIHVRLCGVLGGPLPFGVSANPFRENAPTGRGGVNLSAGQRPGPYPAQEVVPLMPSIRSVSPSAGLAGGAMGVGRI